MTSRRLLLAAALAGALLPGVARSAPPCAADMRKFCSNVPMGGGRIEACLKEHEKDLSPECAANREKMRQEMGALVASCRPDISRFCATVSPGEGRIAGCLREHRSELSPPCKDGLGKQPVPK